VPELAAGRKLAGFTPQNLRNLRNLRIRSSAVHEVRGGEMKDSLAPGITLSKSLPTTAAMGISHLGPGGAVLSTPAMIGLMELTSLESVKPHLEESENTVGTMVHVWHRAAVKIGETVQVTATLKERDRRKLLFEVKVTAGDKLIGDGTHERFVIDLNKFGKT
jgi:predicted thioesterase